MRILLGWPGTGLANASRKSQELGGRRTSSSSLFIVICNLVVWEGWVVVIPFFEVLQFDILAKLR